MSRRWTVAVILGVAAAASGAAWAKGGPGKPGGPPPDRGAVLLVAVVDAAGKPAPRASVVILGVASSDERGEWLPSARAVATADAKGIAAFSQSADPVCLLAWTEKEAGFICNMPAAKPPERMTVTLGPGVRLAGRVVGPDSKPVAGTRVRVCAPGGYEWHHFDAEVGADGAVTLPTLPAKLIQGPEARVELIAPGMPFVKVALGPGAGSKALDLRFPAPRRVKGRLVADDARPVQGAIVHTADWDNGPTATADAKGAFDFGPLTADVRRVFVVSKSHGDVAVDVPEGDGTLDVGEVKLPPGAPIKGTVRESDGMRIRRAFLALSNEDGFRVATAEVSASDFEFPRMGNGSYLLDVYVHELESAKSWRHVCRKDLHAGDAPLDITVPTGLDVKLVDASGKPFAAREVRLSCEAPDWKEPWKETFSAQPHDAAAFSEIRFGPMPPNSTMKVTVTVAGQKAIVISDVAVDADGCATVTATIGK